MRQVVNALIAMTCLFLASQGMVQAQLPPQPGTVSVGFRNLTKKDLLVKCYTVVPGGKRNGQILQLPMGGGKAYESNVPQGIRYISVYDALQPRNVLLQDFAVPIQNRDVIFDIVPVPGNPNRVMLAPVTNPKDLAPPNP